MVHMSNRSKLGLRAEIMEAQRAHSNSSPSFLANPTICLFVASRTDQLPYTHASLVSRFGTYIFEQGLI